MHGSTGKPTQEPKRETKTVEQQEAEQRQRISIHWNWLADEQAKAKKNKQ